MSNRRARSGWTITISALVLAVWVGGVGAVAWRGLGRDRTRISNRIARIFGGRPQEPDHPEAAYTGPLQLSDLRLSSLRQAAESWQRSAGPRRRAVDQVCLVPDAAAFLEAIALWDEQHFFPILIDEPAWTLPFLRAYRPARVVRFAGTAKPASPGDIAKSSIPPTDGDRLWSRALEAVARAWSGPAQSESTLPAANRPPGGLGVTPPGLVLSDPEAPMLAGAVAMAAGRFQPLVRLQSPAENTASAENSMRSERYGDVLSLTGAVRFARLLELRVAGVVPRYDRLGDDCDFLTIAGDWPYRYSIDLAEESIRGVYALDDLIGRVFDMTVRTGWLNQTRRRWAYTGRILGDPAASVARAMGALFLQPESALLWNTYTGGSPWSDFTMGPAAADVSRVIQGTRVVMHRSGEQANLSNWHGMVDPANRFGMVLFNSSGGPDWFRISGGPGRPSDIPRGLPASVAMIHSFSAADPTDPQTIAGRWLSHGAFAYFGSVNEPFLLAFRPPRLVAALLAADIPLVAALRQGENEPFGFPWRLVYLGDPLYSLQKNAGVRSTSNGRIPPGEWRKLAPDYENWPVAEITARAGRSGEPAQVRLFESDNDRLRWCLDASIGNLAGLPSDRLDFKTGGSRHDRSRAVRDDDWRKVLKEIHRDRLDPVLRPCFDELLIDALEEIGALNELMARLVQIPSAERGHWVWEAIETCAMQRLARMSDGRGKSGTFGQVLDLWDELIRLSWPPNSRFPAHFSERVGTLALADAHRSRPWLDRLNKAGLALAVEPDKYSHSAVITVERARVKSQLGGLGASR
jgi:hypothetical protein